jgi:gamma-glutamyl phosphate reductase
MELRATLKEKKRIVVSSGVVGIGKNVLGISEKPADSAKQAYIIEENQKDIMLARKNKMTEPLIDRLLLNENRIRKIAEEAFPVICDRLSAKGVEIRGDEAARQIDERIAWA